jgi:hypothetical protein
VQRAGHVVDAFVPAVNRIGRHRHGHGRVCRRRRTRLDVEDDDRCRRWKHAASRILAIRRRGGMDGVHGSGREQVDPSRRAEAAGRPRRSGAEDCVPEGGG